MDADAIRVIVHGCDGKMGQAVLASLGREKDLIAVGGVDVNSTTSELSLPDQGNVIPVAKNLDQLLNRIQADVVVDFTNADGGFEAARICAERKVHLVSGSTGWSKTHITSMKDLVRKAGIGALIAPNFALGAVLLLHFASVAGRFFEYAEVFETHHENKLDAPSGTALAIAQAVGQNNKQGFKNPVPRKEPLPGTRGNHLNGVAVHSSRMPGRMAHHELLLGAQGQTLSLRHDTTDRTCYMPGVSYAIRYVPANIGLTVGLENILGLK